MNELKGKREIRKLRELIRKYKSQGYEIYADYPEFERPQSIAGVVPDLIVKKGDQEIIIEITSDESLPNLEEKLRQLSEYAAARRGTRFDLVITNPRPKISYREKINSCEYLLGDLQRNFLREARHLYNRRHFETSFLILCRVLESIMKELALKKKIIRPREKISINQLNDILSERRVLSRDDFTFIQEIFNYRNKIVHRLQKIEKGRVQEYINFVSTLLKTIR